jgi:hypothetical protein
LIKIKNILKLFLINLILILALINLNSINAQINFKVDNNFSIINYKLNNYDQLDQYQNNYSIDVNNSYSDYKIFYKNSDNYQWCAQSFKPTLPVLTKVNLLIYKLNISCVLILSIRNNLSGNDLVVMSKGSNEIFEKNNLNWITFDFPDINVITNNTYYIIVKCYSGLFEFEQNSSFYSWIYGTETKYNNGELWLLNNLNSVNWENILVKDFCFETYGCSNRPPENPTIQGPINGEVGEYYEYTFLTIDPDEDNIYYCVEGGDSESEVCMGPFKSGEQAKAILSWQKIGTHNVRVKARDIKGAESGWTILEVKMPIVNHHNNLIYSLEKYKYLTIVNLIWRQIYE